MRGCLLFRIQNVPVLHYEEVYFFDKGRQLILADNGVSSAVLGTHFKVYIIIRSLSLSSSSLYASGLPFFRIILPKRSAVDIISLSNFIAAWDRRMDMAVLKSNLCPTCGGLLNIDLEKQMYVCTFCGVSFDYEYFREDNVKEVASTALQREEYGSAKDAYDFMLAKDPHDFEALRGLFLCKSEWTGMDRMLKDEDVQVSADDPALQDAIDKCLPENRPYFEKVREALSELRHYRDLLDEAKGIDDKKDTTIKKLSELEREHYQTTHMFTEFCDWLKEGEPDAFVTFLAVAIVLPLGFIIYCLLSQEQGKLIAFAVIAAVVIIGYHLIKFIGGKVLTSDMVPFQKELAELNDQYDAKKTEAKQSIARYKALVQEFMDMDPLKPQES